MKHRAGRRASTRNFTKKKKNIHLKLNVSEQRLLSSFIYLVQYTIYCVYSHFIHKICLKFTFNLIYYVFYFAFYVSHCPLRIFASFLSFSVSIFLSCVFSLVAWALFLLFKFGRVCVCCGRSSSNPFPRPSAWRVQ